LSGIVALLQQDRRNRRSAWPSVASRGERLLEGFVDLGEDARQIPGLEIVAGRLVRSAVRCMKRQRFCWK
jgi:hypothetical protein